MKILKRKKNHQSYRTYFHGPAERLRDLHAGIAGNALDNARGIIRYNEGVFRVGILLDADEPCGGEFLNLRPCLAVKMQRYAISFLFGSLLPSHQRCVVPSNLSPARSTRGSAVKFLKHQSGDGCRMAQQRRRGLDKNAEGELRGRNYVQLCARSKS